MCDMCRLVEWRDQKAFELDESPTFLCPSAILVLLADKCPQNQTELVKLWSPSPPIMLLPNGFDDAVRVINNALKEYAMLVENFNRGKQFVMTLHDSISTVTTVTTSTTTLTSPNVSNNVCIMYYVCVCCCY
jgi:hypothetical protein